jgi:hypothetical protein
MPGCACVMTTFHRELWPEEGNDEPRRTLRTRRRKTAMTEAAEADKRRRHSGEAAEADRRRTGGGGQQGRHSGESRRTRRAIGARLCRRPVAAAHIRSTVRELPRESRSARCQVLRLVCRHSRPPERCVRRGSLCPSHGAGDEVIWCCKNLPSSEIELQHDPAIKGDPRSSTHCCCRDVPHSLDSVADSRLADASSTHDQPGKDWIRV